MKSSSSSSSKHQSDEDQNCNAKNSPSNFLILPLSPPFSFIHGAPFSKRQSISKPNFQLLTAASSNFVRQVHSFAASTSDKFLRLLQVFASQYDKFLSFSSRLQSCSQVCTRALAGIDAGCVFEVMSMADELSGKPARELHHKFQQIRLRSHQNMNVLSHNHSFAAILPGDSVAGIVVTNGILNFLNLYNTLLVVRLVLTWFPNAPPAVVSPLSTICDPYLNIFRGIIPPLGGTLDLSPILAFLVLNVFTSTASALPAELPSSEQLPRGVSSHVTSSQITTSQEKWMRRIGWNKSKTTTGEN